MVAIAIKKAFASAHRALYVAAVSPTIPVVDTFLVLGQSNAAGTVANPSDVVVTGAGVAWAIMREPQPRYALVGPLRNGSSPSTFFGASSPWPAFAQRWYDLTGRRSIWSNLAFAGSPLHPLGLPDQSRHWATTPYATSMVGGSAANEEKPRDQIIQDAIDVIDLNPRFNIGLRFAVWCGGEADGLAIASAKYTQADFETELHLLIDKLKADWGIDYMLIFAIGREGTTEAEVDANETAQGMAAVRAAQLNVAAARTDTFVALNAAKEKGTPFNTITEDGSGYWVSGWSYYDGVHYTPQAYRIMGTTGARNAAQMLGLA